MSAEVLREAAALMRERAEACLSSDDQWYEQDEMLGMLRSVDSDSNAQPYDAEHIASWHPAVALAVADLLDIVEAGYEDYTPDGKARSQMQIVSAWADSIARAYLGSAS